MTGCWIDLFEGTDFSGTMRRIPGPRAVRVILPGNDGDPPFRSLIVGPTAHLLFFDIARPHEPVLRVPAKLVVPDVRALAQGRISLLRIERSNLQLPDRAIPDCHS